MRNFKKKLLSVLAGLAIAGSSYAAEVLVNSNITTSTTWTASNTYNLQKQIYVEPGATLTIEAGTLVQSTSGVGGSLAVCRGAKIYVNGTKDAPVIMTSSDDNLTSWHEGCSEWGNLTIMGDALISASHYGGEQVGSNTKTPTGLNEKQMEGLVAEGETDPNAMYGGGNDDDDSGEIHYLSLRYGGKVVGFANELNGLSLGGIGRATDIDHVEIMNNVDDGIEIWGGTVGLKYVSIWNIGDDSFDIDEGWRGKAQFVLIVQGYSADADQGSGVGDNCFETDGAEDCDAQPVTTATIYNATVIGQPDAGDGATTWRDNARMQYRNCIFMNIGEELVRFDDHDGDGAWGYSGLKDKSTGSLVSGDTNGEDGTLSFYGTWATPAGTHSTVNAGTYTAGDFNDPAVMYQTQTDGMLAEITDSVMYGNATDGDDHATAVGVFDAGKNNVVAGVMAPPIQGITRGADVTKGGKTMKPVTSLNPCAANDALTSVSAAPADGFFTPASFRGAFSADNNWLEGWTAADAYGMTVTTMNAADPTATGSLTKIETTTSFDTESGVLYTVEKSSDMKNWSPVETLTGTGSTMSVEDLDTFESGKFYRVVRQ